MTRCAARVFVCVCRWNQFADPPLPVQVFVPPTRSSFAGMEVLEDSPLLNVLGVVKMLLFGWCARVYLCVCVDACAHVRH